MREILFRGKTKHGGEWVYGGVCCSAGNTIIVSFSERILTTIEGKRVLPETVGQYTGLTDKNGKKIFEGDICQTKGFPLIDDKPFVVEWNDDECSFYWRDVVGTDEFNIGVSQNTTIIGNIHDNPELLKGE
ncbi:MAG: YopX family protein [Clostridia bacterium]|nr:YopX family protein [Clostridia bacterium]